MEVLAVNQPFFTMFRFNPFLTLRDRLFIFLVDFIVLDTQPVEACNPIPVILGCPFLETSNALINCRNGLMKLSFGNMTLEMNIFNICKQQRLLIQTLKMHENALRWTIADTGFIWRKMLNRLKKCNENLILI